MSNSRPFFNGSLVLMPACLLAACGGGGGAAPAVTVPPPAPTLSSIALSPLAVSLAPGGTQQLSVTGTYSDGSTKTLPAASETFTSSDTTVATVSAAGLATVATGAPAGATTVIGVTDSSGVEASSAASTIITVTAPPAAGPPTANSTAAATATAKNNQLCSGIAGFYWEIGNEKQVLASGSIGTDSQGDPLTADTKVSIASASKWVYGTYIVQVRGSAAALTANDVDFMHFTSGYTNMGTTLSSSECPDPASGVNTVNVCLSQKNPQNGLLYTYRNPATRGKFDYDSGHLENHASLYGGLGDTPVLLLGPKLGQELGADIDFLYTEPLMSGGIYMSGAVYAQILRNILSGALAMHDALGTNAVCTRPSAPGCNAAFSPIPEGWHYSITHWVEDDPDTAGDGAFSSPGAFGFYPWIDATKTYYGILSREAAQVGGGEQSGYASAQCGRLIRRAWVSGVEQTGALPN